MLKTFHGKKFIFGRLDNKDSSEIKREYRDWMEVAKSAEEFIQSAVHDFEMLEKAVVENGRVMRTNDRPYLIPAPFNVQLNGPWQLSKDKKKRKRDCLDGEDEKGHSCGVLSLASTKCLLIPGYYEGLDCDVLVDMFNEYLLRERDDADDVLEEIAQSGLDGEGVTRFVEIEDPVMLPEEGRRYRMRIELEFVNGHTPTKSMLKKAKKFPCYQENEELDWDECEMWSYRIGARFSVLVGGSGEKLSDWMDVDYLMSDSSFWAANLGNDKWRKMLGW